MDRRSFLALAAAPAARAVQAVAPAKLLHLRVTDLKTFLVNAGGSGWVFCKLYTNQGLVGLGEGSMTSKEATVAQAI
ncbi:MAG: hypothetical protein K6U88_15325, partial [Dehalococcoidia bacterium]|nr:hypothetical protein [Dehalococcoidia bacterium]